MPARAQAQPRYPSNPHSAASLSRSARNRAARERLVASSTTRIPIGSICVNSHPAAQAAQGPEKTAGSDSIARLLPVFAPPMRHNIVSGPTLAAAPHNRTARAAGRPGAPDGTGPAAPRRSGGGAQTSRSRSLSRAVRKFDTDPGALAVLLRDELGDAGTKTLIGLLRKLP